MKFKIIPLEERIVLDAAGASDIVDSYHFEHQLDANALKDGVATPSDIIADSHDSLMVDHTGAGASANRVIVLSSHVKDADILAKASLDNTKIILYDPSSTSLNDLSNKITAALNGTKADNITFVNDGNASGFKLTDNTSVSLDSLNKDQSLQIFWQNIGQLMKADGQVDLLVANLSSMQANKTLINELGSLVGGHEKSVHFASTQDLLNHSDTNDSFNLSGLKSWSDNLASTAVDSPTNTSLLHILLVASDVSDSAVLAQAAANNVKVIYYDSEHTTLQQLSDKIFATLNGAKADSIAFANEGSDGSIRLTSDITITSDSLRNNLALQNFWHNVGSMVKDGGRIDLLACYVASTADGKNLVSELDTLVDSETHNVSIAASTDRTANAAQSGNWTLEIGNIDARSTYFNSDLLNKWSGAMDLTGGGVITIPPGLGGPGMTITFYNDHYSLPNPATTPTLHVPAESGIKANDSNGTSSEYDFDTLPAPRIYSNTSHGTLSLNYDGSFDYTPTPGFKGTDTFTYTYEFVITPRPGEPQPPPPVTATVTINVGYSIQDVDPGSANSNPHDFVQIGNKIFFVATTAANGTELWVRDLNTDSISLVADRQTGFVSSGGSGSSPVDLLLGTILNGSSVDTTPSSSPSNLTAVNGMLYFTATDSSGTELWKTDGTAAGTVMVKDITPGSGSTAFDTLYNANGTLFFVVNGNQLWKSSGDSAGTISVKQFAAGSHITSFANQGGVLYYSATDGTVDTIGLNNFQVPRVTLWRTDIASNATEAVVKQPGIFGSNPIPYYVDNIISYNNTLYFTAYVPVIDGATGSASIGSSFWKANGIPQGTAGSSYGLVYQTFSTDRFTFDNVTQHNGSIFFTGVASDTHRTSLFVSNGTTTTILKDFYNNGFGAMSLTSTSSGILYFVVQDSATTAGIWRSDGSVGGTVLLKDFSFNPSLGIFPPANLIVSGNSVYFTANDGISGTELWKTDGTAAGTVLIDLNPGSDSSNPTNLHIAGNKLSFAANNGIGQGVELYSIVANQPPSFNVNSTEINSAEDSGLQTIGNWITGISSGAGESDPLTFTVTTSNPSFFTVLPTITMHGTTADITYQLAPNVTGDQSVTITISDGFSTYSKILTWHVGNINDAPSGSNITKTIMEDQSYTISAADFGFSDLFDNPSNSFAAVKITTLPTSGTLLNNGVAVTVGQFISIADINSGKLTYTPPANAYGSGLANFTFQVQDDGGLGNGSGGENLDPSANTFTFNVTAVNDAPTFNLNDPYINAGEDATPQVVGNWITGISAGPGETGNVTFTVTSSRPDFFSSGPTLNVHGTTADVIYTLAPNVLGNNEVTITISDGTLTFSRILTWRVGNTNNDPPMGTDTTKTILEDSTYVINASDFGFSDPTDFNPTTGSGSNSLLAVKITTLPTNGTLTNNGVTVTAGQFISLADINNGKLTFKPAVNTNGNNLANFTFQVQDDGGTGNGGVDLDPTPNTFTFNVTPVNDAPSGSTAFKSILEDTSYTFALRDFGFSDSADGNTLMDVKITTLPTNGSLTNNGVAVTAGQFISQADITGGKLIFTPASNVNGSNAASFTFQVRDNGGTANGGVDLDGSPNTFRFDITFVSDPPSGTDITKDISKGTSYTLTVNDFLLGFSDVENHSFVDVKITTLPTNGTLTFNGVAVTAGQFFSIANIITNQLIFTPSSNEVGAPYSSFTFQVRDNGSTANGGINLDPTPNTFTFNVINTNNAPIGESKSVSTSEDTILNGSLNFSDVEGDNLAATVLQGTAHGTLVLNNDGTFTYTPAANYNGSDSFTYKLNDGTDDSAIYTVTINVAAVNDAPVGESKTVSTNEDTTLNESLNLSDIEDDSLTATVLQGTAHGTLVLNNDGTFTYTPAANYNGSDSFTYKLNDGTDDSAIYTVTINIAALNDAPVAVNDSVTTAEDTAIIINVLGNDSDVDGTTPTIASFSQGAHGSVTLVAGKLVYTPAANYNGTDSITYTITDGSLTSTATVNINITPVNDAPVAVNDSVTTAEDNAIIINVLGNDSDVDGTTPIIASFSQGAHGSVTLVAGKLVYTPAANYNGTDSITYTITDGSLTSTATVNINITPVNDAPVAANDAYSVNQGSTLNITAPGVIANDNDVDGNTLLGSIISGPGHGSITFNANGSFNYTPNSSYSGTDFFTYKVNDGSLDSNIATVTLTVNPVNHAPVANNDSYNDFYNTGGSTKIIINALNGVLTNDIDQDAGTTLTAQLMSGPSHGTLQLNADGSFSYTANAGYSGIDSFTYKAKDGQLLSNAATVNIVVDAKPQLRLEGASFRIYRENDDPLILSTAAQVSDADSVNFGGAKLIINISGNATNTDILSIVETNKINISGNSIYENGVLIGSFTGGNNMSPLVITFNSNAVAQDVREVVRHIGFSNSSDMPSTLDRTVSFTLQDAQGAQSDIQTKLVKVSAINDGAQVGVQDNTISVNRNIQTNIGISSMAGLSLSDIDGTSNSIYTMTLQVNKGTLNFTSLSGINGLLFLDRPDADGLSTIIFAGTRDQINLALSRLTYTSRYNFTGQDKLIITAMDTGLSAGNSISSIFQYTSGYFLLDKETIFITVS